MITKTTIQNPLSIIIKYAVLLAFAVSLIGCATSPTQPPTAKEMALANKLLALQFNVDAFTQKITDNYDQFAMIIAKQHHAKAQKAGLIPAGANAEKLLRYATQDIVARHLSKHFIRRVLQEQLATKLSVSELEELIAFYQSPVGKKVTNLNNRMIEDITISTKATRTLTGKPNIKAKAKGKLTEHEHHLNLQKKLPPEEYQAYFAVQNTTAFRRYAMALSKMSRPVQQKLKQKLNKQTIQQELQRAIQTALAKHGKAFFAE